MSLATRSSTRCANDGCSSAGASVSIARAPGRLDVMGGIADYSGSLVLERPIAEATWAAVQRIDRPVLEIVSLGRDRRARSRSQTLAPDGAPVGYDEARRMFADSGDQRWAAYIVGVVARARARARTAADVGRENRRRLGCARGKGCELVGRGRNGDHGGRGVRIRNRARAARSGASVPDGREPRRRCAVRRDGPDDVRVRRRATRCWRSCASLPNCRRRCRFPTTSNSGGSIRASVTRWADPTTAPSARARSWGCASSPSTRAVPGEYLANIAVDEFEQELARHLPERDVAATNSSPATAAPRTR